VKTTVFLGGGRITSVLVAGLRLAGYEPPIVVHDRHSRKLQELKRQHRVIVEGDLAKAIELADLLIVAVRPDSVRELLKEIREQQPPRRLTAVSLVAGIPLSRLQARLGLPVRWARAMPSPVCRSGQGLTGLTFGRGLSVSERATVRNLFSSVGAVMEIPENQFDAFTVTYSSSHGYHALAALVGAAVAVGLDRKTALVAAAHALADGIAASRVGNLSLGKLLKEAATPGGIAEAVMAALDQAGYRRIVKNGLYSGIRRARKNASWV
jgi:pyrroline-5-carboxylate reductase